MNNVTKIFGPPGTGKTTTLLDILEHTLEQGTAPERVAYMTFTVKARREAVERTKERFGFTDEQLPYFRTLHSIAYRQLNVKRSQVVQDAELREFSELIGMEISGSPKTTESGLAMTNGNLRGDRFINFEHLRRHRGQSIEEAYRGWREEEDLFITRHFCNAYQKWKSREALIDFTDLLLRADKPLPVDIVFVDEAQDLSALQWQTLEKLAAGAEKVYVAGDDDQAIFSWAGADPNELLNLKGDVRVLGQSYRIPSNVHRLAGRVVERIKRRQEKAWKPRPAKGELRWLMNHDNVDYSKDGSYMVLYRNHYLGKTIEDALRSDGTPFGHSRRSTVGGAWSSPIVLWEKLRKNESLSVSQLHEIYNAMSAGRSITQDARVRLEHYESNEVDMQTAQETLGLQTTAPWFDALDKIPDSEVAYIRRVVMKHGAKTLTGVPKVQLSSIHAAKGGEADHVVLLTDISRVIEQEIERDADAERRVFYVGLTRCRESLQLVGFNNPLIPVN